MDRWLEPFDLVCDAPPYGVVQVCRELGFEAPEDVRWLEAGGALGARGRRADGLVFHSWNEALAAAGRVPVCSCGGDLPFLEGYLFTLGDGTEQLYAFGQ